MAQAKRARIISALSEQLRQEEAVLAVWLEGADALGRVDEFSDIDLCCAVAPGQIQKISALARTVLETLGPLDLANRLPDRPDWQEHTVFHLEGDPAFLLIDFMAYQAGRGSQFTLGDEIEKPLVIFDRAALVTCQPPADGSNQPGENRRLQELRETVAQSARLEKYLRRGEFLEAVAYYQKWLLAPLVEVLRMKYTPLHPEYYLVHISRHLPANVLARLEDLFKFDSIAQIDLKSKVALCFFEEIASEIEFPHHS